MKKNQKPTIITRFNKDSRIEHLNQGLQHRKSVITSTQKKIAYKLGVKYELIFSTSNG
jgi:hypothetical protein